MSDSSNISTIKAGREGDPFVQVPEWILLAGLSPQAVALYTVLQAHVNNARGDSIAWPGMDLLAAILGFKHRNSVGKYVTELVGVGAVDVERQANSTRRHNIYLIHKTPPDEYTGPRSLKAFHAARKAADGPTHTVVGIGTHTRMGVAPPTGMGQNQTNATRRSDPDEVTSGDAFAAGAQRTSSQGAIEIIKPHDWHKRDEGKVCQFLVAAVLRCIQEKGLVPHPKANDEMGKTLGKSAEWATRDELLGHAQRWVDVAGTDHKEGWLGQHPEAEAA